MMDSMHQQNKKSTIKAKDLEKSNNTQKEQVVPIMSAWELDSEMMKLCEESPVSLSDIPVYSTTSFGFGGEGGVGTAQGVFVAKPEMCLSQTIRDVPFFPGKRAEDWLVGARVGGAGGRRTEPTFLKLERFRKERGLPEIPREIENQLSSHTRLCVEKASKAQLVLEGCRTWLKEFALEFGKYEGLAGELLLGVAGFKGLPWETTAPQREAARCIVWLKKAHSFVLRLVLALQRVIRAIASTFRILIRAEKEVLAWKIHRESGKRTCHSVLHSLESQELEQHFRPRGAPTAGDFAKFLVDDTVTKVGSAVGAMMRGWSWFRGKDRIAQLEAENKRLKRKHL